MSDRYSGVTKCPYCNKNTDYFYAEEWSEIQVCDNCGKKFKIVMCLKPVKILQTNEEKK